MARRLLALLMVAAASGTAVGTVSVARATEQPKQAARLARIPALAPQRVTTARCPLPARYRAAFVRAAADTSLPLALLVAVGQVESNLDHSAVSSAGARGILQVMPTTAAELDLDPDHAPSNVLAGARYLRKLFELFASADLALAAYNAGPTAVAAAGGAPFQETLSYVANVNARWRALAGCS